MIKKAIILMTVGAAIIGLTGCASIVSGKNQSVSVTTGHTFGATCSLENNKGRWYVNSTPGSVVVNRSFDDLRVNCHKPGYAPSYTRVVSKTKPIVFGNVLFGGVVGAGVDVADGAAYDYPTEIYVPLKKSYA